VAGLLQHEASAMLKQPAWARSQQFLGIGALLLAEAGVEGIALLGEQAALRRAHGAAPGSSGRLPSARWQNA
jgi:hypothetical protein